MAKKQSKPVVNFPSQETQEVLYIRETVTVGEQTVEIPVKIAINCEKATYKITASLTTKAVHPTNPEIREAIADNVRDMVRAAMEKAEERRRYWSEQNGDEDPSQGSLFSGFAGGEKTGEDPE